MSYTVMLICAYENWCLKNSLCCDYCSGRWLGCMGISWSPCSADCGLGDQSRSRTCSLPLPRVQAVCALDLWPRPDIVSRGLAEVMHKYLLYTECARSARDLGLVDHGFLGSLCTRALILLFWISHHVFSLPFSTDTLLRTKIDKIR
jgi:hypothetical protein